MHWPGPRRQELAVGSFFVEVEGLSSREVFGMRLFLFSNIKSQFPPREQKPLNSKLFPVFPRAALREYYLRYYFLLAWKPNFATLRFYWHSYYVRNFATMCSGGV